MVVSVPTKPADVTKKSVELHIPPGNVCMSILFGVVFCGTDEDTDDDGSDDALSMYNIILSNWPVIKLSNVICAHTISPFSVCDFPTAIKALHLSPPKNSS